MSMQLGAEEPWYVELRKADWVISVLVEHSHFKLSLPRSKFKRQTLCLIPVYLVRRSKEVRCRHSATFVFGATNWVEPG